VKARITPPLALIFKCLACTKWSEIWFVSWCVFFFSWRLLLFLLWWLLRMLLIGAPNDRSGDVYVEKNDLPAHPCVVGLRFLLRCNSWLAWLQVRRLQQIGILSKFCFSGHSWSRRPLHTTGSEQAACSAPKCGQNADNCSTG
jgi:hypothetical protein